MLGWLISILRLSSSGAQSTGVPRAKFEAGTREGREPAGMKSVSKNRGVRG